MANLRHQLRPMGLIAKPAMAATGLAMPGDMSACNSQRNTIQLRPQPSKAGAGQGGMKRCIKNPSGGSRGALAGHVGRQAFDQAVEFIE